MRRLVFVEALVSALAATSAFAQSGNMSLGTVHLAKKAMADGKTLAPGTYQVRLTSDEQKPGVGQSPDAEEGVEFLKGGKVAGREVANVIRAAELGQIAEGEKAGDASYPDA